MAILNNSNAISSGGYDINNSVRLRSSASAYLNRTPASATNRKTWTWSAWVKRGAFAGYQNLFAGGSTASDTGTTAIFFNPSDGLTVGGSTTNWLITTQVFRDPSAWYHVVIAMDTTNATANNRLRIYINGSEVTAFSTRNNLTLNTDYGVNQASLHRIGFESASIGTSYFDGYLAEVNFVDGSAKTPSDFGETDTTTGSWKPKAYSGTYGTNGFYLKFSDIATTSGSNAGLGKDFSGNTNYFNTNNISVTAGTTYDAMIDSPTLTSATVANYAVLNPLDNTAVLSEANLKITYTGAATWHGARGSIYVSSGKYYWEVNVVQVGYLMIGIASPSFSLDNTYGSNTYNWTYFQPNGNKYGPGIGGSGSAYGASYTAGDVIGVALDMDAGTLTFYKNNTSQGTAFTGITGLVAPVIALNNETGSGGIAAINFGQRPFTYTPPTGFVRLNTYNLPDSTVVKGNTVMDATLYTGTGASLAITNAGAFKPDLVWVKGRSGATDHALYDSVRGTTKQLESNTTTAETTEATGLTAFGTGGFTVGALAQMNTSAATYVGWQWQAGQGSTSSNTSGSITSTVSANTTAGFSIVTYTGTGANATVGHGLGVAPKMIFIKNKTSGSLNWGVYNATIGNTKVLLLNTTAAASAADPSFWNNTSPTSTTFSLSTWPEANNSGNSFVAYCWAEIAGFSAFGSYTGNGNADGAFVYLGFRPKFVMIKASSSAGYNWYIWDTSRNTYNVLGEELSPNLADAAATQTDLDITSNGFKLRTSASRANGSGITYIYAAYAENPFKNANAR